MTQFMQEKQDLNGMTNRRAVCGESRKHGSEGGRGKSTERQLACCLPYHLTIASVTRSSTGEPDEQAERSEFAGTAAEAQAFKRACSMFTVGRYLYHLPSVWVDYDASAKQFTDQAKAKLSSVIVQHYTRAMGEQTRKRSLEASPPADPQADQRDGLPDADQAQPLPASPAAPPQAETSENVSCALAMAALNAKGAVVFAKHWEAAQSWLVERYTAKVTPANIRHRLTELTSDELEALLAGLTTNTRYYGQEWHKHRKAAAKTNQSK